MSRFCQRTATVGSRLSPPRPAPVELARPTQQGHRPHHQCIATGESLWSSEHRLTWTCLCATTGTSTTSLMNCNGGTSIVFCIVWAMGTDRCIPTCVSSALPKNWTCGTSTVFCTVRCWISSWDTVFGNFTNCSGTGTPGICSTVPCKIPSQLGILGPPRTGSTTCGNWTSQICSQILSGNRS